MPTVILIAAITAASASVAAPKSGSGQGQPVSQLPPPGAVDAQTNPAFALPQWGDGQWGSSEHYGTIFTADLDGDGDSELLGRSDVGLEAWDFDGIGAWNYAGESGQWLPLYVGGALGWSDDAGWDKRAWYETIGAADLDGDGADEVFGRSAKGIEVYRFDIATKTWSALPRLPEYTDAQGWDHPEYYRTIQAADLDGDGADEIFGRGAGGLSIWALVDGAWQASSLGEFTDKQGWDKARYYSTIQAADVDGDGRAEVIGRSANGMTVWGLDAGGAWVLEAASGPYPDDEGWDNEPFYATIGTADLDGDGRLDVYGRGARSLSAYLFNDPKKQAKKGTWTALPRLSEYTNAQGWNHPQYYETIQAADVDGDGRDEIIGRGGNGMRVWGLDPSTQTWTDQQRVAGPGFTNALGWNQASRYTTIQTADVDGYTAAGSPGSANAARMELIGRGPSGIQTYRFDTQSGSWVSPSATFPAYSGSALSAYQAIGAQLGVAVSGGVRAEYAQQSAAQLLSWATSVQAMARPKKIAKSAWRQVQPQIGNELLWAAQVATMLENASRKVDDVKALEGLDTTADYLEYDTKSSNGSQIVADLLQLFAGLADAVSNLSTPGAQVLFGSIDALASFGFSGIGTNGSGSSFEGTYIDLRGRLEQSWGLAQDAIEAAKQGVMSDYGLLQAVGSLYKPPPPQTALWQQFGPTDAGWSEAANHAARAYSVWVWQVLTPTLPKPCGFLDECEGWIIGKCESDTCLYTINSKHEYELWTNTCNEQPCSPSSDYIARDELSQKIPSHLHKQMFDKTDDLCLMGWDPATCDYGIPVADVFLGRHGWSFQCSLWQQSFWDSGWLPDSFCQRLADEAAKYGSP